MSGNTCLLVVSGDGDSPWCRGYAKQHIPINVEGDQHLENRFKVE